MIPCVDHLSVRIWRVLPTSWIFETLVSRIPKNVVLQQAETIQFATKLASWELGKQSMGATSQGLHGRAGTHYFHDSPPELVSTWQLCTFPILPSCNCLRFGPATGALAACRPLGGLATDLSAEYQHNGSRHHSLHAVGWATSTHEWLVRLWGEDLEEKGVTWRTVQQFEPNKYPNPWFCGRIQTYVPKQDNIWENHVPDDYAPPIKQDIPQTKFKSHHSSDVATWGHCNLSKIVCVSVYVCVCVYIYYLYIYIYIIYIYMVSPPMVYLRPHRRCRGVVV